MTNSLAAQKKSANPAHSDHIYIWDVFPSLSTLTFSFFYVIRILTPQLAISSFVLSSVDIQLDLHNVHTMQLRDNHTGNMHHADVRVNGADVAASVVPTSATVSPPPATNATVVPARVIYDSQPATSDAPQYMFVDLRTNMGGRYLLRVRQTDTVERIKVKIAARLDIPVRQQQLMLNGRELFDHQTVPECGIVESASLLLAPRLCAGPLRTPSTEQRLSAKEEHALLVESVAAHLADPNVQQAVARGEPLSFVARIGGKYMMVRLNTPPAQARPASSPAPSAASPCCHAHNGTVDPAAAAAKVQLENAHMRKRITDIRARLQEKKQTASSTQQASHTTAADATPSAALPYAPQLSAAGPQAMDIAPTTRGAPLSPSVGKARSAKRNRCHSCPSKLGLVHFPCKCGNTFCVEHRQAAAHTCTFKYNQAA